MAKSTAISVTLSLGTPLCPYEIAHRRRYGICDSGSSKKKVHILLCGTSVEEQQLYRNVQRFQGGLAFKAHRLVYHSILGLRVIMKKKENRVGVSSVIFRTASMFSPTGRDQCLTNQSEGINTLISNSKL